MGESIGANARDAPSPASSRAVSDGWFCGLSLNPVEGIEVEFRYVGEETIDGVPTHHFYHSYSPIGESSYRSTEYWFDAAGLPKKTKYVVHNSLTDNLERVLVYSGWGEPNRIAAPDSAPTPAPIATSTPTTAPAPTATRVPTSTPLPTDTPEPTPTLAPTLTPTPLPPPDAWLEPDPETVTFNGQWRQFTIRGTGLQNVDVLINVINYPDGPSSTGTVELHFGGGLPSASDACQSTFYTGYLVSVGRILNLVGCSAGTVIIQVADPGNDYIVLREYTVTVSGGP